MKIAILGAGAAGLAALRHSLEYGHSCRVFEQTGQIGGTWNYSEQTDCDEFGLPIHSSMYKYLRTNLPKELMGYEKFPYKQLSKSYITQDEVLDYIQKFAKHFNLLKHIEFFSHVKEVKPKPFGKWILTIQHLKNNNVEEDIFDAVIVSSGHHSVSRVPELQGIKEFSGRVIHSHTYRIPDPYRDKRVLIIGCGPSAIDISRILLEVATKVVVSFKSKLFGKMPSGVTTKPWVKRCYSNQVEFEDNSFEVIDDIIFCTGYKNEFPFLTEECNITISDNQMHPLYKHLINIEHPTMAITGLLFPTCPFIVFGIQVKFFLEFLSGNVGITKDAMQKDLIADLEERKALDMPKRHSHKLIRSQEEYLDGLCDLAGLERCPRVFQKLHDRVKANRDYDDVFQIIDDDSFIQIA